MSQFVKRPQTRQAQGFSLGETLVAIGLLSIVILAMGLLSLTIIRSTTESNDRTAAAAVATSLLDRVILQGQEDPNFWDNDHLGTPYVEDKVKFGKIDYHYKVLAETVLNSSGDPLGEELPNNRLKRVTLELRWFDTESGARQGYGDLSLSLSRLVNEVDE